MSLLQRIIDHGVSVSLAGDKVRLEGLAALSPDQAREVVEFTRRNKARIMAELSPWFWQIVGRVEHPGSGKAGLLVKHHPSGRFALDVGRHLLSVNQEWAEAEAARWLQ